MSGLDTHEMLSGNTVLLSSSARSSILALALAWPSRVAASAAFRARCFRLLTAFLPVEYPAFRSVIGFCKISGSACTPRASADNLGSRQSLKGTASLEV